MAHDRGSVARRGRAALGADEQSRRQPGVKTGELPSQGTQARPRDASIAALLCSLTAILMGIAIFRVTGTNLLFLGGAAAEFLLMFMPCRGPPALGILLAALGDRLPRGMQLQLMGYCFVALTGFTAFSWAFSWLAAEMLGVAREVVAVFLSASCLMLTVHWASNFAQKVTLLWCSGAQRTDAKDAGSTASHAKLQDELVQLQAELEQVSAVATRAMQGSILCKICYEQEATW
ncbi:unnamed protein product [Durusdinium trenchii]|uniref:Vesicle transport protein n=1 Tax=Durusdinium trenchii TaxID=1381693 RepID=A0ABP0STN5_9DINO